MKIFFITGYPRSRTAWLAVYLTRGKMACCHDALAGVEEIGELAAKVPKEGFNAFGFSDPAAAIFYEEISPSFPNAQWIIIRRNKKDVRASMKRLGWADSESVLNLWEDRLNRIAKSGAVEISFSNLDNEAPFLGRLLDPEWHSHPIQEETLRSMNIQIDPVLLEQRRIACSSRIARWLAKKGDF